MHAKNKKYSLQVNDTHSDVDTNVKEKFDTTLEKSVNSFLWKGGKVKQSSFRSAPSRENSSNLTYEMEYEMDVALKHHQKMLSYDWIAALLENGPQVVNQSEMSFEELKQFRKLNLEECINQMYMEKLLQNSRIYMLVTNSYVFWLLAVMDITTVIVKLTFQFLWNIFIGPQELWEHPEREPLPVQKALEETKYPKYSIPRSTLISPYRVKSHLQGSFDGSDSLALSQHCLKGFNSTQPSKMPATTSIALRDSTRGSKSAVKTTLDNAEQLAANYPYEWNSSEQSIFCPFPHPTYCLEASYSAGTWPSAVHSSTSFTP